jgi:hypothetical protein
MLVVKCKNIIAFKSGDRVSFKYKETGINQFCPPKIDCELFEIKRI